MRDEFIIRMELIDFLRSICERENIYQIEDV
jgi:hypothetical protein